MRRDTSIEPGWFEDLYQARRDPWSFETSAYEAAKHARTLAALPANPGALLEVGCSIGVLTAQLAPRCAHVLAVDVSPTALALAAERCAGIANVAFAEMRLPQQLPSCHFDTVLLSEVAYYWDSADLARVAAWLLSALEPHGHALLVHWTGPTDYPKSADEAIDELRALLGPRIRPVHAERTADYRLDLWRRA